MAHRSGVREASWMFVFVVFSFITVPPARAQNEASGEKIYKQTLRATAWILTPRPEGSLSMGTGSLIDLKHKLVITNYHVVGENNRVLVLFPAYRKDNKLITERKYYLDLVKDGKAIQGKVLHRDAVRDLAVISLDALPQGVHAMRLARESPGPGQRVHSIGNPGSSDGLWLYTSGTVRQVYHKKWQSRGSQRTYSFEAEVVETQSPTNPGDSGGPLVNDQGDLVAVTQGTASGAQLLSLFIDVSEVKSFLASKKVLPKVGSAVVRAGNEEKPKEEAVPAANADEEKQERMAASKLEFAKTLADDGKLDKARIRFEDIVKMYPKTRAAGEAKLLLDKMNK
jgi:S1-C subfamily serine protease